ncbi:hypothetical protein GCM10010302_00790 [Streptomyces polychromogenes]|uniref:Uncharacterized protein n=1 Tax=Streptomyces polychromogenes TaxID=67342 RepID=A0ABN0UZ16_9ACTN
MIALELIDPPLVFATSRRARTTTDESDDPVEIVLGIRLGGQAGHPTERPAADAGWSRQQDFMRT